MHIPLPPLQKNTTQVLVCMKLWPVNIVVILVIKNSISVMPSILQSNLLACLLILIFHSIILYPFGMLLSAYTVSVKPVNLATQPNDSKYHYNDLLPYTTHLFTRSHRTVSEHTSTVIWPKWTWSVQIYLIVKNVEIIVLRLSKSKH